MDNEKRKIKYENESLIIQANELVRSKQDEMTILEAKLIRLAIAQQMRYDNELYTYTCKITDLVKFLGLNNKNIYNDIQSLATKIMQRTITIKSAEVDKKGNPNYKIFHWVDYAEYKDGIITFKLSEQLKPYLLGLEALFTKYEYGSIIDLPTNYSIRLYELLASWYNSSAGKFNYNYTYSDVEISSKEVVFTIDYLREYFHCKDKYPNTADFLKYIIDSSVAAILKNTYMLVSYRKVKDGRSIKYIVFRLNDSEDEAAINNKKKLGCIIKPFETAYNLRLDEGKR